MMASMGGTSWRRSVSGVSAHVSGRSNISTAGRELRSPRAPSPAPLAQRFLDLLDEDFRRERFREVARRPEAQAEVALGRKRASREHDDRQGRRCGILLEDAADVEAREAGRERDVEKDEVRSLLAHEAQRLLAARRLDRLKSREAELEGEDLEDRGLVVHDGDFAAREARR